MNALVGGPLCANHAGRLKVRHEEQGVLSRVVPQGCACGRCASVQAYLQGVQVGKVVPVVVVPQFKHTCK
eukprot:875854-Pelagomonas_calceolata.AAC.1